MNKTPELKPCPFCGGEAKLVKSKSKINDIRIKCAACGIKTGWWMGASNEMLEQWNTRVPQISDDSECLEILKERDRYEDMADELADAIAEHFDVDIGEHSSANDPWENALDWISPVQPRKEDDGYSCVCGQKLENWGYCPNCGQKLDWEEEK